MGNGDISARHGAESDIEDRARQTSSTLARDLENRINGMRYGGKGSFSGQISTIKQEIRNYVLAPKDNPRDVYWRNHLRFIALEVDSILRGISVAYRRAVDVAIEKKDEPVLVRVMQEYNLNHLAKIDEWLKALDAMGIQTGHMLARADEPIRNYGAHYVTKGTIMLPTDRYLAKYSGRIAVVLSMRHYIHETDQKTGEAIVFI